MKLYDKHDADDVNNGSHSTQLFCLISTVTSTWDITERKEFRDQYKAKGKDFNDIQKTVRKPAIRPPKNVWLYFTNQP